MKHRKMASLLLVLLLLTGAACTTSGPAPDVDSITAASGSSYYKESSYDLSALKIALKAYPYPTAVSVATVNEDGSPNLAIVIPALSEDENHLTFGLADNRTRANFIERKMAVVMFYEYTPSAEKAYRNKGCKVVVKYVGDEQNTRLNQAAGNEKQALFMEIIRILPIG